MSKLSEEREALLLAFMETKKRLEALENENQLLKESNYQLNRQLEEKETAVMNLFSYIESISPNKP
jgi:hypothetical protein